MDRKTERREAETEFKRARFIEAALEILKTRGLAALTMEEVARQAGYSIGSIYNYFQGKDDLLVCAIKARVGQTGRILSRELAAGLPVEVTLGNLVRAFLATFEEGLALFLAIHDSLSLISQAVHEELHEWLDEHTRQFIEDLAAFLRGLRAPAESPHVTPEDMAWALLALLHGEFLRFMVTRGAAGSLEHRAPVVVEIFLHGVLGPASARQRAGGAP